MSEFPKYLQNLSLFRHFIENGKSSWETFTKKRNERLVQAKRNNGASEKVAENILEDFFTIALDWKTKDLNNQVEYADIVLTDNGIKRLIIEVKKPGSLKLDQSSLEKALKQAWRYADNQRVKSIAVSDGNLLYAADIINGGLQSRAHLSFDDAIFPSNSWWVSVNGISRTPELLFGQKPNNLSTQKPEKEIIDKVKIGDKLEEGVSTLLHPKYKISVECFAYAGNASDPKTWKLPCWTINSEVDTRRLPGAIRAVLTNYRGVKASLPEEAIPDILVRLGKAAATAKQLPGQTPNPSLSYQQLHDALKQIDRLNEVL